MKTGCLVLIGAALLLMIVVYAVTPKEPTSSATTPVPAAAAPTQQQASAPSQQQATAPTATKAAPTATPKPTAQAGTQANPYPSNATVTVGEAKWQVVRAEVKASIEQKFLQGPKNAQGKFVVVVAKVENLSNKAVSIQPFDLSDSKGRKFEAEAMAPMWELEPEAIVFQNLNPNMPLSFTAVFDVPKDAEGFAIIATDLALFSHKTAYIALGDVK